MNHFDEMTCLLYLEGQLDAAREEDLTAHTAQCGDCRALLQALQRETHLLSSALTEENEPIPAHLLSEPGQNQIPWAWIISLGLASLCSYAVWTFGIEPWQEELSAAGFNAQHILSLLVFTGAFWKGWSGMINTIQIIALILFGGVAFGVLRRRLRQRTTVALVLSILTLGFVLVQPAGAAEVQHKESYTLSKGEVVHTDLIVASGTAQINGTVEGDLIAFGSAITVSGHVTGDVIVFGNQLRVDGTVDGNVRAGCNTVVIGGNIGKNVMTFSNIFELVSSAQVGGGVISMGNQMTMDGHVHRDVLSMVSQTVIDGAVDGRIMLRGDDLSVGSTAELAGPVTFQSRNQPRVADGAKLASPITLEAEPARRYRRLNSVRDVVHELLRYGAAVVIGLILLTVLPGFFRVALRETGRYGVSIGIGALALMTGVVLLFVGFMLLFVGVRTVFSTFLVYIPLVYFAQVFVGAWLGGQLLRKNAQASGAMLGQLALGLLILHALRYIPYAGGIIWLLIAMWGTGAMLIALHRMLRTEPIAMAA